MLVQREDKVVLIFDDTPLCLEGCRSATPTSHSHFHFYFDFYFQFYFHFHSLPPYLSLLSPTPKQDHVLSKYMDLFNSLIRSYTHTLIHIHTRSYTHILIYSYTHTLIHSYTHTLMHSYTYTLIHSYILTHSRQKELHEINFENEAMSQTALIVIPFTMYIQNIVDRAYAICDLWAYGTMGLWAYGTRPSVLIHDHPYCMPYNGAHS